MKKILFLIVSLFSINALSQNVEYFNKIRNLDKSQLESVANEIVSYTRDSFKILNKEELGEGYYITYIKEGVSEEEKLTDENSLRVVFEKFVEGENKALEIEGIVKYRFYGVTYNYLDLFPYWQKYFAENADKEQTTKDFKLQRSEYKKDKVWWLYKFEAEGNSKKWTLRKFY